MDISSKVEYYKIDPQVIELIRSSKIVLLAGIAGAGKDTLKRELLKDGNFRDIVSHTTRKPRANNGVMEVNSVDYHFINSDEAEVMIEKKAFVEVKLVHGDTIYGTSVAEIQEGHDQGKISITDVDIQGVDEYKKISQSVIAIFMLPPSYKVWRERLSKRYESVEAFNTEWGKRRASALKELEFALSVPYYHFIINDDIQRSIRVAHEIAAREDSFYRKDDEARIAARDILHQLKTSN